MGRTEDQVMTSWVPGACTLPTVDQPLRQAEFDDVFAESGRCVERTADTAVRVEFEPAAAVAARLADLAMRECSCCSFFGFTLRMSDGRLLLDVEVPAAHLPVLDALAARATSAIPGARA
ncbi:hypothetical protein [Actinocatenispora sera]|jgi:hypothetical protein|nr:hypothetical protein [Actinocatenispora sera]